MVRIARRPPRLPAALALAFLATVASGDPADVDDPGAAGRRTSGSAFLVGTGGHLVTNAHVVATCDGPRYTNGPVDEPLVIDLIDTNLDVAILSSRDLAGRKGLALRSDVTLGGHVTVFGYPLARTFAETGRPTLGVLLGYSADRRTLMTNAQVQAGNSGGPIFDQTGAVIGMAASKSVNRTFAVSAVAIADVLERAKVVPPMAAAGGAVLSVADVIARARQSTGKIDCKG